jgi:uncharacterized membrane protein YphA (DoxX/SURF4 family)
MSKTRQLADSITRWLPVVLRVVAVTVTVWPAIRKFTQYSYQVQEFASYGVPFPEIAVPVSGAVELFAVISLAGGIAGRLGAGSLLATMVVAIATAGPSLFSGLMLVASAGIFVFGTGPYSYWDPSLGELLNATTTSLSEPAQWSGDS